MSALMDSLFLVCDCELDLIFLRNIGEHNLYKCKYKLPHAIYNNTFKQSLDDWILFWELPDFCSIFQVALFELCPLKWTHPWSLLRPRTRHQCFPRNPQPSFAHVSRSQTFVCKHKSGNFQHHHTIEHNVVHVYKNNTQPINWEECPTFCNAYLKKGLFIFLKLQTTVKWNYSL